MKTRNQVETEIKYLGYYQIIGGVIGIIVAVIAIVNSINAGFFSLVKFPIYFILCLPFVFSMYVGFRCIDKKPNRLRLSKWNQVLQVIGFGISGYGYTYIAGIQLGIGLDLTESYVFNYKLGLSMFQFNINQNAHLSFVMVNILALFLVYRIIQYQDFFDLERERNRLPAFDASEHLISD